MKEGGSLKNAFTDILFLVWKQVYWVSYYRAVCSLARYVVVIKLFSDNNISLFDLAASESVPHLWLLLLWLGMRGDRISLPIFLLLPRRIPHSYAITTHPSTTAVSPQSTSPLCPACCRLLRSSHYIHPAQRFKIISISDSITPSLSSHPSLTD